MLINLQANRDSSHDVSVEILAKIEEFVHLLLEYQTSFISRPVIWKSRLVVFSDLYALFEISSFLCSNTVNLSYCDQVSNLFPSRLGVASVSLDNVSIISIRFFIESEILTCVLQGSSKLERPSPLVVD